MDIPGVIQALGTSEWTVLLAGLGLIVVAILKVSDRRTRKVAMWIGVGLCAYSLAIKTVLEVL